MVHVFEANYLYWMIYESTKYNVFTEYVYKEYAKYMLQNRQVLSISFSHASIRGRATVRTNMVNESKRKEIPILGFIKITVHFLEPLVRVPYWKNINSVYVTFIEDRGCLFESKCTISCNCFCCYFCCYSAVFILFGW